MKLTTLHFERSGTAYYYAGQPAEYYYDFGIYPLDSHPCSDILEKTRLIYALWELFSFIDTTTTKSKLPKSLLLELNKYFSEFDGPDLSHWALLEYETLNGYSAQTDPPIPRQSDPSKLSA